MAISAKRNIPDLPPFKLLTVLRHYTYLWPYTMRVRYGRITRARDKQSAGKILGGGPTGLVVWRDEFIAKYPELRGYNVYREEVESGSAATAVRYELVFKPREGEAEVNSFQVQQHYQSGATFTLDQLLHNSPLLGALNHTFGPSYQGDKLLSLAYFSLLTQSLAYQDFLFFQADTRLPYPDALTERDINNLLSTVSDVDLAAFMSELSARSARRINRKSRLYALQVNLPHNLLTQMSDGKLAIYTNQEDLDQVIARDVHDHAWHRRDRRAQLTRFSQSQSDRALVLFNASTGHSYGYHTYKSDDFNPQELAEFLTSCARPERQPYEPELSPEQSEFAQALKNTKELEQKTGYVDLSKPDRLARTRALNQSINLIGALSPTGSAARALRDLGALSHIDPTQRHDALLGANRPGSALTTVAPSAPTTTTGLSYDPVSGLIHKPELVRRTPSAPTTARRNGTPPQELPTPVVLVQSAPHDLIAALRHNNQLSQPVLYDVPLTHHVARYLKNKAARELLDLAHYDHERQRFTLTLRLPHRYPEYDLSTKADIFSQDPLVQRAIVRPAQRTYELVVHLVLDLEPLLAASAHTKQELKEQAEAQAEADEGFEDTVFEQETKQGTVRLSARQAKKLSAIELGTDELLEELPQASFWQGQDSIKPHTKKPLRALNQEDLDLIDDVVEALSRLGEETLAGTRTSSLGTSVVAAWRHSELDPDFWSADPEPALASTPTSVTPTSAAPSFASPAATQPAAASRPQAPRRTSTRLSTPLQVQPLEGQKLEQPPEPVPPAPVQRPSPSQQSTDFFARQAAILKAEAERKPQTPVATSDAERLALLMQSMVGTNHALEAEPNQDPSAWLPRTPMPAPARSSKPPRSAPPVTAAPQPAPTIEPHSEPHQVSQPLRAEAQLTEADDTWDDPETERQAEALAAQMLDEADAALAAALEPNQEVLPAGEKEEASAPRPEPRSEQHSEPRPEPHRAPSSESFFDLEDDDAQLPRPAATPQPKPMSTAKPPSPKEPDDADSGDFFELEEEEHEEVDPDLLKRTPADSSAQAPAPEENRPESAAPTAESGAATTFWDLDEDELDHATLAALLAPSFESTAPASTPEPTPAPTTARSEPGFEVPSAQLQRDEPLVRSKPKALGALETLAAAAEERRAQRAARVLTPGQKKRLQRDLEALLELDLTHSLGCFKVMVTNQVADVNEAYSTVQNLDVASHYLDLLCYDTYKVERALLNPMALKLKPRLQQLLRGKGFVLFCALSLHLMLKSLLERKDAELGGRKLRQQQELYDVPDLLTALNRISAARRDEGLFYPDLKMQYRSLFELVGVQPPSFEAYDDSVSEQFVHLRRSNTGR